MGKEALLTRPAHDTTRATRLGVTYGLAAYLLWGFFPLFFKWVAHVPPLEVLAHRIVWSLITLLFILAATRGWGKVLTTLKNREALTILCATTLLIWTPPNFHVPSHWHSGSEKHVVIRGTFIIEAAWKRFGSKAGRADRRKLMLAPFRWSTRRIPAQRAHHIVRVGAIPPSPPLSVFEHEPLPGPSALFRELRHVGL